MAPYYLWRPTPADAYMVYDADRDPITDAMAETVTPSDFFDFWHEAQAEADRRNRGRKSGAQGELVI